MLVSLFCFVLVMNVMLGYKNVSDVLYAMCYVSMQCQLENKVCNVSYIVLSFMYIIFRCCLILCYVFMFVVIMFKGGNHYKFYNFFSIRFPICIFYHV